MFLGTISVCLTVLVLNLHHRDSERSVPKWFRIFCFKYLARILCVTGRKPKTFAHLEKKLMESHDHINLRDGLQLVACQSHLLSPSLQHNGHLPSADKYSYQNGDHTGSMHHISETPLKGDHYHRRGHQGKDKKWNNSYEWKEVAHILDRLFFAIVFMLMTASVLIIVTVPYYRKPFDNNIFETPD